MSILLGMALYSFWKVGTLAGVVLTAEAFVLGLFAVFAARRPSEGVPG
jgi:hypothetical protein